MSDTSERVKKIVVEHLGIDENKVNDSASFIDDLGADSLDTVELVMAFEEEFEIEIPDDAAEKIQTIKDAIDFIKLVKPKKTILTNLHIDLDYFELKKKLPKNIVPAYDGISFNF